MIVVSIVLAGLSRCRLVMQEFVDNEREMAAQPIKVEQQRRPEGRPGAR